VSCCCHKNDAPAAPTPAVAAPEPAPGEWVKFAACVLLGGLAMSLSLGINLSPPTGQARLALHGGLIVLCLAVFALLGGPVLAASWQALRRGRIVTDQLFVAGMFGAFGASLLSTLRGAGDIYYEVVLILLAIHTLGRLLTERQRSAAARTLDEWRATLDRCTRWQPDGTTRPARVGELQPGDHFLVRPGESVPLDGCIARGTAYVQETAHTGEAFPAARGEGDRVLAGSIVLDGDLVLRSTATSHEREVDRLARAVAALTGAKSRLERLTDRAVSIFLPAVIVLSLATFVFWWWHAGPVRGLFNALAVLLVACPCALGIALPLAQRLGLQRLAELGLVPHHADAIERLARVDTLVFDKTGTLTELDLEADAFRALTPDPTLPALIAEVQRHSSHPVARPFWSWSELLPAGTRCREVRTLPGQGIAADFQVKGIHLALEIGNETLLTTTERAALPPAEGRQLYIRKAGQLAAIVTLRESPRPGITRLLAALRARGTRLAILTGDTALPAELRDLDLTAETQLSAAEKSERVATMQRAGHRVLYLGDGLNDTEVMARADASLALCSGHPAAREAADGEWLTDSLDTLPAALAAAAHTHRQLRRIIAFAFTYNAAGIALAVTGQLHPVAAALLMLASSFTVTTLANIRLRLPTPDTAPERDTLPTGKLPTPILQPVA
jgi:heavy metal translocating P-type ATPase